MKVTSFKLILALSIFFTACAGSKEARTMKSSMNGNWNLETITVEGNSSVLGLKVFNEADNNCFIGSSWNFIANNGSGNYNLMEGKGGCSMLSRKIKWSVYEPSGEEKKFQFKRLDDKGKPLDGNDGFRLSIKSLEQNNMSLVSQIMYEGKPLNIVYNFVKK